MKMLDGVLLQSGDAKMALTRQDAWLLTQCVQDCIIHRLGEMQGRWERVVPMTHEQIVEFAQGAHTALRFDTYLGCVHLQYEIPAELMRNNEPEIVDDNLDIDITVITLP